MGVNRFWWLWSDSPKERNATVDQAGRWNALLVGLRSYRAFPVTPAAAPPGWMDGNVPASGNIMPVPVGFVRNTQLASQVNLPVIGPTDESIQRAHALQAALAASLTGVQNAPRKG